MFYFDAKKVQAELQAAKNVRVLLYCIFIRVVRNVNNMLG